MIRVPSYDCYAIVKAFESCRLRAYPDPTAAGGWAVGWGHTGPDVIEGLVIPQDQADGLLQSDCRSSARLLSVYVRAGLPQSQFDALVSITYNVGAGRFASGFDPGRDGIVWLAGSPPRHSTLLKLVMLGDTLGAADEFLKWDHVGGLVSAGLARRRAAERALFLKGVTT